MATTDNAGAAQPGRFRENWRQMLGFGSLFIAVLGVVLVGAVLRTTAPDGAEPPIPSFAMPAVPPAAAERDLPVPVPAEPDDEPQQRLSAPSVEAAPAARKHSPAVDELARRTSTDIDRLAGSGFAWTAQLAVLCDSVGARETLQRFGGNSGFYLLPAMHDETPCFRVCWGQYATREEARLAADMPGALRTMQPAPLPKAFYEVLE